MKMKKLVFSIMFVSLTYSTGFDSNDGAPIRQGVHIEWYRTVSPGDQGEAIFVWSDTRYGMRNIFAHKINHDGSMLWGESGAIVTNLPGRQEDPVSIEDGNGGVFIAWVDYRFDAQGDIFIQHLDSDGNLLMDENGIALAQVDGNQITINMCTDSLGGVFVTWQDKRGGVDEDIYGTHVSADNEIVAPGVGVAIAVEGGNQNAKTIEYAGDNQAFIAWADYREGENANIYGQRLNMDMTAVFAENGIPIANTTDQETKPRATFVNGETSFVTWKRGDANSKVYYQFVNESGLVFTNEKAISDDETLQAKPRVKRNSLGEVFVKWTDYRDDAVDGDQYFQKVNVNGDREWGNGVKIDPGAYRDFSARFNSNENGGLNVAWERGTFPDIEIMVRTINADGTFPAEPLNLTNSDGYQFSPILIGSTNDQFYIIYADQGTGSIDLKIQKIDNGSTVWGNSGITAMVGLDGDIKYTSRFRKGENDFFLTWEDNRSAKRIYGTRITENSVLYQDGKQLSYSDNSSDEIALPIVIKDDNNFFVGTYDATSTPKYLRINKLDESFENLWDSVGVAISSEADMRNAKLVSIGSGVGCFWSESRLWDNNIYFQYLDNEGNAILESGGVELVDASNDDFFITAIPTPDNKLMVFWMNEQWNPSGSYIVIKYLKIDQNGNTEIGWNPGGINLTDNFSASSSLQVKTLDDGTGIICLWNQIGNFADIYAQKVDWDGNKLWETNGLIVTDDENDQTNFSFSMNDTQTKALIVWEDFRNGQNFEIFGQLLNLENGSLSSEFVQFTSVVNDSIDNYMPTVENVTGDEFMVIWEDGRGYINDDPLLINGVDLYGSGFKVGQGMTTDINGVPICIAYHKQQNLQITHYSGEEFFLDWVDYRSSGKEDLANYYGRILSKAELLSNEPKCFDCDIPTEFSLKPAYPNPFNGKVAFEFFMPEKEAVNFRIYDITGRVVTDKLILPDFGGNYRIYWDGMNIAGQLVTSGIYFYEFNTSKNINRGKVTYLK